MSLMSFSEAEWLRVQMISDRSRFVQKWQIAGDFLSPRRFNMNTADRNRGQSKEHEIINGQGRRSLRTFISGMVNGSTPRSRPWFKLTTLDKELNDRTSVKRYFAQVQDTFNSFFQVSNLYRVLPMAYKDVGTFSNAAYAMLPHPRFGFYFQPFTIGSYAFSSDSEGNTTTFMREFTMSVRQVVERYANKTQTGHIDWTNMDPWVRQAWEEKRYNDQVHLTNLILPNPTPQPQALFARDKAYQSYTWVQSILGGGSVGQQVASRRSGTTSLSTGESSLERPFISIRGYDYFPVITPRWEVAPEEDYGDEGPGEIALADVQTLQELERGRLEAVDKLLRPPMVGPAALRRVQASILAGGITYLDEADNTKMFRPAFQVDPKLEGLLGAKQEYEQAIKSAFFEDLFLMLADERKISHVTAREIEERSAEKLSALGPVLGQLDQDQNRRLIDNAFIILGSQGRLPVKPDELRNQEIKPEYISVLAQAQKASLVTSSEKLVNFVSATASAFQDPSLLKIIKPDQLVRQYADFIGIDPRLIRDEQEYEALFKMQQQLDAAARTQLQAKEASETAKNLSQAQVGDSNMLELQQGQRVA